MRFAYADPPYPGCGHRYKEKADVNHTVLIARLMEYDGWALSTSSPSLGMLMSLCPASVRVAAWVKPFAVFKPNVNPAYAWEPVLFVSGRKRDRKAATVRDWHVESITLRKGLVGAKPPGLNLWILDLIGWQPGDEIDDLFPGTGGMGYAVAARRAGFGQYAHADRGKTFPVPCECRAGVSTEGACAKCGGSVEAATKRIDDEYGEQA